jgi:DNA-binding IscR family transcriptional regulator
MIKSNYLIGVHIICKLQRERKRLSLKQLHDNNLGTKRAFAEVARLLNKNFLIKAIPGKSGGYIIQKEEINLMELCGALNTPIQQDLIYDVSVNKFLKKYIRFFAIRWLINGIIVIKN